jgi:hypothetical protein
MMVGNKEGGFRKRGGMKTRCMKVYSASHPSLKGSSNSCVSCCLAVW